MNDPCATLEHGVESLETQIKQIQNAPGYIQGPHDPHPGRPDPESLAEVKQLLTKLTQENAKLNACKLQHGGKPDVTASFSGTATLTTTNSHASGPYNEPFQITLFFRHWDHTTLDVSNLLPIQVGPFSTPVGSNTLTVTQTTTSQGTCNPSAGVLKITLPLHFHESNAFIGDSDVTFVLSTENGSPKGSRMNAAGKVTLAGSAVFQGGTLGGDSGTLVLAGTVSPHP